MKQIKNQKTYIKLIIFALVLSLSLFLLAGCGTKSDDAKDKETIGVTQEEPQTDEDSTGQIDNETTEGTDTEGTDSNETPSSNDQDGTSDKGNDNETNAPTAPTAPTTPASTCTIQINCNLLVGKDLSGTGLETLVPADGIILGTTKVTLNPGETVYDMTLRVTKAKKIHMASQGSVAMGNLYIAAISNIYEKAYNSKSGWVYLINGKQPGIGSGIQKLKAGDALVWAYSLNLGNDL